MIIVNVYVCFHAFISVYSWRNITRNWLQTYRLQNKGGGKFLSLFFSFVYFENTNRDYKSYLILQIRQPTIGMCENKGTDQLCSNCKAGQHLCFRYTDSTILFLLKSEISSFLLVSVTAQISLFLSWLETQIVGFLT